MIQPLLIGLLLPAAIQERIVEPSPPPDRFDLEHHELLVRAWGGRVAAGPPGPQRPAIRPARWSVVPTRSASNVAPGEDDVEGERESPEPRSVADGASDVAPFALAETTVRVDEDEVRFIRAPGARAVFVNGEGFVGDPERRGDLGVPVLLRAGENLLELVDFGGGDLDVELWDPVSTMVLGTWALDYDAGWGEARLPIFNASTRFTDWVHFHYDRAFGASERIPALMEFADAGPAAPLGMLASRSIAHSPGGRDPDDGGLLAPLCAYVDWGIPDLRLVPLPRGAVASARSRSWKWPARREASSPGAPNPVLVYEMSGPGDLAREALAVARYCQQLVWYRTGEVLTLGPDVWLTQDLDRFAIATKAPVVRFGHLGDAPPGTLVVRRAGPDRYEIRAADAAAMRLVYTVDPFFSEIDDSRTFAVR